MNWLSWSTISARLIDIWHWVWRPVPGIIGDLKESIIEFIFITIASFPPIWMGIFIAMILQGLTVNQFIDSIFESGEMMVISLAIIGPTMYTIVRHRIKLKSIEFPFGWLFFIAYIVMMLGASVSYSFTRASEIQSNGNPQIDGFIFDDQAVFQLSLVFLVISCILTIAIHTIRHGMSRVSVNFSSDTEEFLEDWSR